MAERLCVVMPVYNEREAVGAVLKKWDAALSALGIDYEIRPYNDGSRDDSLQVMHRVASGLKSVSVRDKPNGGHGNTILTGYREAASDGFDWVFQVDSDDEMGPEKFPELWRTRNGYDFLVGIRDGRKQRLPRKIISFLSRCCVRLFYGCKTIWDVNTPYRLMRVSAFKDVYRQIPLTTFAPNVILSGMVARKGLRYHEIRVPQHDRTTGEVSIKKWKLLKAAVKSFGQTISFSLRASAAPSARSVLDEIFRYAVVAFAILSCFAFLSNPVRRTGSVDSSVFAYIGDAMHRGLLPYRDVFDHKGPLIYIIDYLGMSIGKGFVGIWFVESSIYLFSIVIFARALSRIFSLKAVLLGVVLYISVFIKFAEGGGLTEVYATDIIMITWSFLVEDILSAHLRRRTSFIAGVCASAILLLRPNMFGICFPVAAYVILYGVKTGFGKTLEGILYGAAGMMLLICPVFLWLVSQGILRDMVDCYIRFNMEYFAGYPSVINGYMWLIPLFIVINFFAIMIESGKLRKILAYNLMFLTFSSILVVMKGNFLHYLLPVMPACIFPIAWVVERCTRGVFCHLLLASAGAFVLASRLCGIARSNWNSRSSNEILAIKPAFFADETVMMLGNMCYQYFKLDVRSASRYPYQPREGISEKIDEDIRRVIESKVDKYIVARKADFSKRMEYVRRNYEQIGETDNFTLWRAQEK